jgi:CBS domain-containing protein
MLDAMKVRDVMTTEVLTLREEDNLEALEDEMRYFDVHHLPVVDGDRLVGLITHRDILRYAVSKLARSSVVRATNDSALRATFVASVMNRQVQSVAPDATLREAAQLLVRGRYGCLPVVDADNRLVGIITNYDIVDKIVAKG